MFRQTLTYKHCSQEAYCSHVWSDTIYGNNLKRVETVTKKIIEIEEVREEKLTKRE